jgi:hypothetical protein
MNVERLIKETKERKKKEFKCVRKRLLYPISEVTAAAAAAAADDDDDTDDYDDDDNDDDVFYKESWRKNEIIVLGVCVRMIECYL